MCLMSQRNFGLWILDFGLEESTVRVSRSASPMNSAASQSSNSGCDGNSPCEPKSSDVRTNPVPKYICQYRLTMTRDVSGCEGCVNHRARPSRLRGAPSGSGGKTDGTLAATFSPGLSYWPRTSTNVSRGC